MFTLRKLLAIAVSAVLATGIGAGIASATTGPLPLHAGVLCSTSQGASNVVFVGKNGTSQAVTFTITTTINGSSTKRTLKVPAKTNLRSATLAYSGHFSLGFRVTAPGMANPPHGSFTITCSKLSFSN